MEFIPEFEEPLPFTDEEIEAYYRAEMQAFTRDLDLFDQVGILPKVG